MARLVGVAYACLLAVELLARLLLLLLYFEPGFVALLLFY